MQFYLNFGKGWDKGWGRDVCQLHKAFSISEASFEDVFRGVRTGDLCHDLCTAGEGISLAEIAAKTGAVPSKSYCHVVSITILDTVCAPDPTLVLTLPIIGAHLTHLVLTLPHTWCNLTPIGAHLIRTEEAKRLIKSGSFHVNNLLVESPLERLDPAKHILKGRFTVLRIGGFQIMY